MSAGIPQQITEFLSLEKLFDGVDDMVFFVKDERGCYVSANDTLLKRCGLVEKSQILGKNAEQVFPAPLGKNFATQDRKILDGAPGFRDHLEMHLYPGSQSGWCLTNKEPIKNKQGKITGVCGISRDLRDSSGSQDIEAIATVLDYVRKNIDLPLRLADLAQRAGMSAYQLDQRIRTLFHLSAGQYLVKARIEAACTMLATEEKAISNIALDCGYSDQSAFSRQFKQSVGMSPLAYRKRALQC